MYLLLSYFLTLKKRFDLCQKHHFYLESVYLTYAIYSTTCCQSTLHFLLRPQVILIKYIAFRFNLILFDLIELLPILINDMT